MGRGCRARTSNLGLRPVPDVQGRGSEDGQGLSWGLEDLDGWVDPFLSTQSHHEVCCLAREVVSALCL